MNVWLLGLGIVLAVLGAIGIAFAPTMIEIRREEGMIDDSNSEITDEDRVLAVRGMGAIFLVVGVLLVASR